ncbi:hypothetical protein BC332_10946 [Capsicum chinense]|nr:hypothetical protein BC332_10946 [Capsicum chinense]
MADELAVVAESKEVAEDMISETVLDQTLYTHLGKEKEHKIRDRDMDTVGGDEEKNDNESKSDVGILHQNLTSASSALQRLLRKLGVGLVDLVPSSAMVSSTSSSQQNGGLKKILLGLRADGEEGKQIEALTQLCVMLSIGT